MSTTVGTTSNDWMQFYEKTVSEMSTSQSSNLGFSDANVVATTTILSPESNISPSDRHHHHQQQQLSSMPKGAGSSSKTIRRRSRASKKTTTTLLNANANSFRALVQQFTGCPLSNRRGPINLNFARTGTATSIMSASGYQGQRITQQRPPPYHLYQQQQQQQQEAAVSVSLFDNVHHDTVLSSSATTTSANANDNHILDDFDFDNISLHELVPYSNQEQNDGNYFF